MIQYDWQSIQEDYVKSALTLRQICSKYGLKPGTLNSKIKKEGWRELKEITAEELENRTRRILNLSDRILDKVEQAIEEVADHIVKSKERSKSVDYDDAGKKLLNETVSETEREKIVASLIDTGSLKHLVATLKDVKDIHLGFTSNANSNDDSGESGVIMIADINSVPEEGVEAV